MKIFRLGELFCGPGGLALGAKLARIKAGGAIYKTEHAWATDYDEYACQTFRHNICPNRPESVICADVRRLDLSKLSPIDAFAFGFPCNDFSVVGEKRGINGEFGPLYTFGVRVLNQFRPDWFLAENVGGLRHADNGDTFRRILHDLNHAGEGYSLITHLYKFEDYDVPQTRHRIIIVGIKESLNLEFKVPAPTTPNHPRTARRALENPPIPEDAKNQESTKQSADVIKRLSHIRPGENAWNANIPPELRLNVKSAKLSQIYKRLHPDRPSYTITGSGGGGTHAYHWSENRALTNRERARLQTFPDNFEFLGPKERVRRQIGMAVPPEVARIIIEAILKTFAGIEYDSVPSDWMEDKASHTKQVSLAL